MCIDKPKADAECCIFFGLFTLFEAGFLSPTLLSSCSSVPSRGVSVTVDREVGSVCLFVIPLAGVVGPMGVTGSD